MPCSPIVRPGRCRQWSIKHLAYRLPKPSGDMLWGTWTGLLFAHGTNSRKTSTCERDRWSARTLQRPGICRATKLILKRRHANTKGRSSAMMWGTRDVWLVMTCTRARCAEGRKFDPRPGQYSRMSFSSDQVTGTVFPHLNMPFLPNSEFI